MESACYAQGGCGNQKMAVSTRLLIDAEDAISPLVDLMEREWAAWYNPRGASARADLSERCQRDQLPLGIVAYADGALAGTCALTVSSGGLVTERSPWLGGLLVDPQFRRQGVAAALLQRALREAGRLGHRQVFALTAHADDLFVHEGWRLVETTSLHGEAHRIYVMPA
jgi:GNAT superfamily N-acetyltransferase